MIIKDIKGNTLYKSKHKTMRASIEDCISKGVDLSFADFRKAHLTEANLDGIIANNASFWGANLQGADIGLGDLRFTDMRCTNLKDTCFAQSDLTGSDLRGAWFSGTIFEGSILDRIIVSCPSFWSCDLQGCAGFKNLVFTHLGQKDIILEKPPIVVRGRHNPLVLFEGACLWGNSLHRAGKLSCTLERELSSLKNAIEKMMEGASLQNARSSIPKIENKTVQT